MEGVAERVFLFAEKLCSWVIERRRDGAEGFREKYKYEVFLQEMNSDGHRCRKVSSRLSFSWKKKFGVLTRKINELNLMMKTKFFINQCT